MKASWKMLFIALAMMTLSAYAQTGVLSVASYGAVCNGTTDDTAKFQAAANAAASSYASTSAPVTVTFAGNCVIAGSISYGSGVHWRGYGMITVPTGTASPTFYAINADNVEWDHVDINFTNSYGSSNPYASGIGWFASSSDSAAHYHIKISNCRISNSAWGISVFYNAGTGSLTDVEIDHNTVTSPTVYSNWDGIHVDGTVSNINIHDNVVTNRGDAALALSSDLQSGGTYTLSQATISNNVATQDLVGVDISGATNVDVIGNYVRATTADAGAQNPAFRQIYYDGVYPINVHTSGNYFENGSGSSYTAKIDPAVVPESSWPALNSTFEKNVISGPNNPLYFRGSGLVIDGNTFTLNGGWLFVDYDGSDGVATSNVILGANRWLGNATIYIGGNASLIQNVKMAPQLVTGTTTITNGGNVQSVSY